MILNLSKADFTKYVNGEIERQEVLNKFLPIVMETIKEFDGKVYNMRLINKLKAKAAEVDERIFVSQEYFCEDLIKVRVFESKLMCVNNSQDTTIKIAYNLENRRISYEDTISCDYNHNLMSHNENVLSDLHDAIDNYDKYMDMAEELREKIDKFNHVNYRFRQNLGKSGLTVY